MRCRRVAAVLFSLPLGIAIAMFGWLAADHGSWHLWSIVVHEDGRGTLADTVLYYRHFLREIPMVALYAAMSAGALWTYGPARERSTTGRRLAPLAAMAATVLAAIAGVGAVRDAGGTAALWDFLQAYLRDDEWAYGLHWRAHLLANCAYLCAAVVAAAVLARAVDGSYAMPRPGRRTRWIGGSVAALVVLTLACTPSAEPFGDPRIIGHAAREAATHVLVSLPLSLGILLSLTRAAPPDAPCLSQPPREVLVALAIGGAIALFLAAGALASGAVHASHPNAPASSLVAAHVFEHTLDYVWLALLSAWLAGTHRPSVQGSFSGAA